MLLIVALLLLATWQIFLLSQDRLPQARSPGSQAIPAWDLLLPVTDDRTKPQVPPEYKPEQQRLDLIVNQTT